MMPTLQDLGWSPFFEDAFQPWAEQGCAAARVSAVHQHIYRLLSEHGELLAEVTGKLRFQAQELQDFPAVGDWVAMDARPQEGRATIRAVLPRRTKFSRKVAGAQAEEQVIAANIDTVFLVSALDQEFNRRRVERYLAVGWDSGAGPVVILNKADLCADLEEKLREAEGFAGGVPVHAVSALHGTGLEALGAYFQRGRTVAMLGSSGVGKSTLINRLLGEDRQKVQQVRASDDRGRHTTSVRELLPVPGGGLLVDTPGLRELQIWEAAEGLERAFGEIEELAEQCRFADCQHESEPGCAVRQAVENGALDHDRLLNFQKLQKELRYLRVRQDQRAQLEQKRKWKSIHRTMRRFKSPKQM